MCLFYKSLNEYGQRQCQYSLGRSLPMCFWLFLWVAQLFLDGIYVVDVVFVCLMAFVVFFMDDRTWMLRKNIYSECTDLFSNKVHIPAYCVQIHCPYFNGMTFCAKLRDA